MSTKKEKLENFWYHYKWQTIIIVSFVLIFAIGLSQIVFEKKNYDFQVLYCGGTYIDGAAHDRIVSVLDGASDEAAGRDTDVNFQMIVYKSEEKLEKMRAEAEAEGEVFQFNIVENNNAYASFTQMLVSGDAVMMILDPVLYDVARDNGALYDVAALFGEVPDGVTDDGYGIKLSESRLLREHSCFSCLPDDSIICMKKVTHAQLVMGKSDSSAESQLQFDIIRKLVG